jgi:hypothetical protein
MGVLVLGAAAPALAQPTIRAAPLPPKKLPDPTLPVYGSPVYTRPSDLPGPAIERMGEPDPPSLRRLPLLPSLVGVAWHFDETDAAMRQLGEDPYDSYGRPRNPQAAEIQRVTAAAAAQEAAVKVALGELPDRLEAIWEAPGMDADSKRRVLFALWNETSDTPEGELARRVIESFIRERLPPGSADAFSAEELAQYRAVGEPGRFDPYGPDPGL